MTLPDFDNEAEFREKWIAPFLTRMGFILPKHVHGVGEQGKDFFFADHDKFGHLRFYAGQVKKGNIGAGDVETDALLNQVRRSFTVTLKFHKGADRQRIAAVYIMASGKISDGAREYISDACRQEHYGENVLYLDGETLFNLERHAAYIDDKTLRQRLVSLLQELESNIEPIQILSHTVLTGDPTFFACRTLAIEDTLRDPFPDDKIDYNLLSTLWKHLKEINKLVVPYKLTFKPEQMDGFSKLSTGAFEATLRLRDACVAAICSLDNRLSLKIEVEQPND